MPTPRIARNLGRLVMCRYGTTENIDFGSHAAYRVGADNQATGGSIAFWFRAMTATGAASRRLMLLFTVNNWIGLYMISTEGLDKSAIVAEFVRGGGGIAGVSGSTGVRYVEGKLHHAVLTWDSTGADLWLDGERVWVVTGFDARPTFGATPNFLLGNTLGGAYNNPANADVGGEAYIYARRLTRGEIQSYYYKGAIPETQAAAWGPRGWNPGGASGGTISLTGGAGNNGVVTNGLTMPERGDRTGRQRGLGLAATRTSPSTAGQSAGWQVADTAALKPTSFTIEGRVRFDNNAAGFGTNYRGIVVKTTSIFWNDGWGLVEISTVETRTIRMWVGSYGNGTTYLLAPSAREVHVVGTYNYVTGTAQMFVEGVLVATWAAGAGLAQVAQPLRMMHGHNGPGGYPLRGTLRDVRYYSRVLNAQEVELRAEKHVDIESGLIEAWHLSETILQGTSIPTPGPAKGRIAGLDATWNNDIFAADSEGAPDTAPIAKANTSRWLQANGLGSARTSATFAALRPGSGSFSLAFTTRLVDGHASTNIVITANDALSYTTGWALNFFIAADGTYTLSAYINSGGPVVSNSGAGQRVIPKNKTTRWVMTCDASTGTVKMYANGKIFAQSAPGFAWNITANCTFAIGYDAAVGWGPGMYFGDVQYAIGKVWNQEEILLDARGIEDSLSGVTHAWPMNETSGTSFRATKGGIDLNAITGTFVEALQALPPAPRAQNLIKYSEQFNNAVWNKAAGVVCTDNAATAPDGTQTACSVDATAASVATGLYQMAVSQKDQSICRSVWVKGTAGQTISVTDPASGVTITTVTFDGTWQRVKNLDPCQLHTLTGNCGIWVRKGTANVWQMWGAQVTETTGVVPYVKTEAAIERGPSELYAPGAVETFERRCFLFTSAEDATVDGSNNVLTAPGRAPGARGWVQSTPAKRPTRATGGLDGHPYMLFNGTTHGLKAGSAFVTDLSTATARKDWLIAAVIDSSAANGSQAVFDSWQSSSADRILVTQSGYATAGKTSWYDGTWREPANSITGPQLVLWDLRVGKGRFYRNGQLVGGEFPYTARMMSDLVVTLGQNFDEASGFFIGKIYDVAIIQNPTDADLLATLDFFRFKFPSLNIVSGM